MLAGHPLITEFMASNGATLVDGDGNSSDWIEIHNPTTAPINLAGWGLSDDPDNLDRWRFPSLPQTILEPGGYLIVFASNQPVEDYIDSAGYLHTDYALEAEGEFLALSNPDQNIVSQYVDYPPQLRDVSYGLVQNARTIELIGSASTSAAHVPASGALDSVAGAPPAWTLPGFEASSWPTSSGGPGVGYDTATGNVNNVPDGTLLPGGLIGFDLTDPEDDGVLNGTITAGGANGSPGGEEPPRALDGNPDSKWLSFIPEGTFYQFHFAGGQRYAVNGYTITSANDAPNRDPYTWTLSGSNDGVNFTQVDQRTAQNFWSRRQTRLYEFENSTPYEYYRFDFLTEFGATGNNQPNSIQMAEIELLTTGPLTFNSLIGLDVKDAWAALRTSVYQRSEFSVDDPAAIDSLTLEMQFDDGFVAYLNGERVASAFAPAAPNYQSLATGQREDTEALIPVTYNLTAFRDLLTAGENVLAIHVLNASDNSSDLLSAPRLTATEALEEALAVGYMPTPTPGEVNAFGGVSIGPIVTGVTENPPRPADQGDLVITAQVTAQASPIDEVLLHYRVMFGPETTVAMRDDGLGGDAVAGDGLYAGVIPASTSSPGEMVRWYVTATDEVDAATRFPMFLLPDNSPEYLGTVVQNVGVSTSLPVFEYFVQNTSAEGTETGTRASVYYLDEFYDNVFVRRRGGNTTQGRKFEFNDGYHFRIDPDLPRVDEINLNQRGAEPTYMRQVLAWELYGLAGAPASLGEAWYTRRNGQYQDIRIFVEQPDADLLRRTGLDPEGAFYKIGADGVENSVTSSTRGVTKRTRKDEDNSDLQALVDGVNPSNPQRSNYVFDHLDIAAAINYIAATSIMHDNDHPHKNFHLYRDTEGSGQWTFIPWDKDLTFGLNFGLSGVIGDQDPFSHPFFGDQQHQKIDNQWNRMIDALFQQPVVKEMYVRRLRTLIDQFLGAPGSAEPSWLETRVAELTADLQPHVGSSGWLSDVGRITGEYLTERRQHLYVNHSADNPGYPDNAGIPAAQVGNPAITFGDIDANPASGNQEQEYIQLVNPLTTAVDISGWKLIGGVDFTFRAGTVIPAGASLYVAANVPQFLARTAGPRGGQRLFVQGNYAGRLADGGTSVQLVAPNGALIAQVTTPGDPNGAQGDVVISETHYHPADPPAGSPLTDLDLEFVEIHNRSTTPIDLTGWQLREGVSYDFPAGTVLAPRSTLLVVPIEVSDPAIASAYRAHYGLGAQTLLLGPYSGQLSNGGERVVLLAPAAEPAGLPALIDEIDYLDAAPWPTSADGGGNSLVRIDPDASGASPTSWEAATPTPGAASYATAIPGDFDVDDAVDGRDFLAWQRGFGLAAGAALGQGDANGDGAVGAADLGQWEANFGVVLGEIAAAAMAGPLSFEFAEGDLLGATAELADLAFAAWGDQQRGAPARRADFEFEQIASDPIRSGAERGRATPRGEFFPATSETQRGSSVRFAFRPALTARPAWLSEEA